MEILLLLLLLSGKDGKDLSDRLTPLLQTLLDNKELFSLLLQQKAEREKPSTPQKEDEKTPPPEEAANEAVTRFLNAYFK